MGINTCKILNTDYLPKALKLSRIKTYNSILMLTFKIQY